jgi:hypothetical protein
MATNGKKIKRKYYSVYIGSTGCFKFFDKIGLDYQYKNESFLSIKSNINPNKEGKPLFNILKPFLNKYKIPSLLLDIPSDLFVSGKRMAINTTISKVLEKFKQLKSGELLKNYLELKKSKWTKNTLQALKSVSLKDVNNAIKKLEKLLNNDLYYEKETDSTDKEVILPLNAYATNLYDERHNGSTVSFLQKIGNTYGKSIFLEDNLPELPFSHFHRNTDK